MSVLQKRILEYGTTDPMAGFSPVGTEATPMTMPIAHVRYDGANLFYDDLHPLYTGDVNAAPIPASAPGRWGQVVGAGRP